METYSYDGMLQAPAEERGRLCHELATLLGQRLAGVDDPRRTARTLIDELRNVGHQLWSLDESEDFEIWGPSYVEPRHGILVTFVHDGDVSVEWVAG